jgi:hypothetical protein
MNLTHAEADRYLRLVPRCDDLELVFLSYLRRVPDERNYISNLIVENSFTGGDLARLSAAGVLFGNGQEHRHNFGPYGEGYGHVMFLNLTQLIQPVSLGPGLMQQGTDDVPLRAGIQRAAADGATVIWCHNTFGVEDIPSWVSGVLHAQNIFDGGDHGTYEDTYYKYLNLGLRVPFSTGTDWFIYDFSRVYVPCDGELTARKWLDGLAAGRSFITNGPLLELRVDEQTIGETLALPGPRSVSVEATAKGRQNFQGLELIFNGQVIAKAENRAVGGHYEAELQSEVPIAEPGWLALRIPHAAGQSELDKPLFAHTSPVYIELAGRKVFRADVAQDLVAEINKDLATIEEKGVFADQEGRRQVRGLYEQAIATLEAWIKSNNE